MSISVDDPSGPSEPFETVGGPAEPPGSDESPGHVEPFESAGSGAAAGGGADYEDYAGTDPAQDPSQRGPDPEDPAAAGPDPAGGTGNPDDLVVGDPEGEAPYWFEQAADGWCGPASVAEIVAQASGSTNLQATELEVVGRAEQLGLLTHTGGDVTAGWSGMQPADIATLLQSFGVPAAEGNGSISDLEQALAGGDRVVAAVDSTTIWDAEGAETVADPGQADHALVVTGIDETQGLVYLNDPGRPGGAETTVSLAVFEQAWHTSGNAMVVAGVPDDTTQSRSEETAEQGPDATAADPGLEDIVASPGRKTYLLPITLTAPASI